MRILLSDGLGLTSRQVATYLGRAGHAVEALAPTRLCLCAFTRHVRRIHLVPAYGRDPEGWLQATCAILRAGRFDVLLPTQEQVAMLAVAADVVRATGVGLPVPAFEALLQVQDKVHATTTLADLAIPQPPTVVLRTAAELRRWRRLPAFVKAPIGTASSTVWYARTAADVERATRALEAEQAFADGGAVVQEPVQGPLVMSQAVFASGALVAFHANVREREGANGGAAIKASLELPALRAHLQRLGAALGWQGGLSVDAILTPAGPLVIDVNPRLVEPGNAQRAGVDLVAPLLALACDGSPDVQPPGRPGVRTHQLLLALLGSAQRGAGRDGVWREVRDAIGQRAGYAESVEELTPVAGDPIAALPVAAGLAAVTIAPRLERWFTRGTVAGYALTAAAWRSILARRAGTPA